MSSLRRSISEWQALLFLALAPICAAGVQWHEPTNSVLPLQAAHRLQATAENGSAVTFRIRNGPAVLVNGSIVVTNVGTVVVTAEASGSVPEKRIFNRPTVTCQFLAETPSDEGSWYSWWHLAASDELVLTPTSLSGIGITRLSEGGNLIPVSAIHNSYAVRFAQVHNSLVFAGELVSNSIGVFSAGLATYDLANPATPKLVGRVHGPTAFSDMEVAGSVLYVADSVNGLQLFEIQETGRLVKRSEYPGPADLVRVAGDYAFIASGPADIKVVDISDVRHPAQAGGYSSFQNPITALEAIPGFLFAAGSRGCQVIDVSRPSQPTALGNYRAGAGAIQLVSSGSLLLVRTPTDGVHLVDISDPTAPTQVGQLHGSILGVAVLPHDPARMLVQSADGGRVFLRLYELAVSIPQEIRWQGEDRTTLEPGTSQQLIASADSGLPVTFSVVSGPASVGGDILTILGRETVVVEATQSGAGPITPARSLRVFNPVTAASILLGELKGQADDPLLGDVAEFNGYLYITPEGRPSVLNVADVRESQNPRLVSSVTLNVDQIVSMVVQGSFLYLSGEYRGWDESSSTVALQVVDVSDPLHPIARPAWGFADSSPLRSPLIGGLAISGSRVFQAFRRSVMVWNVVDPLDQQPVGQIYTQGEIVGLDVGNGKLVVVTRQHPSAWWREWSSLDIFDFAGSELPQRLVSLPLPDRPGFLRLEGNLAIVGYGNRLIFFDISDSRHPRRISQLEGLNGVVGAEQFGRFLILKRERGDCELIDISNPERPARSGFLEGTREFSRIRIFGDRAYLVGDPADNLIRSLALRSGVRQQIAWRLPLQAVVPTNEPQRLQAVSSSGLPVTFRVGSGPGLIQDDTLTVSELTAPVVVVVEQAGNDDFLPVRLERVVNDRIIDARLIGRYRSPGDVRSLRISGDYAYLASGLAGLEVVRIDAPNEPKLVSQITWESEATHVRLDGQTASVITDQPIRLVDVSDPHHVRELGNLPHARAYDQDASNGRVAFLDGVLSVADISDPLNPRIVGESLLVGGIRVVSSGDLAYVSSWGGGVFVADLSSPDQPEWVAGYRYRGNAFTLAVAQGRLYLIKSLPGEAGLQLETLDVSVPSQPKRLGSLRFPLEDSFYAHEVCVGGNLVFVAVGNAVMAIDVHDPAQPEWLGPVHSVKSALDLQASAGRLFVAEGSEGLGVYQIHRGIRVATDRYQLGAMEVGESVPLYQGHIAGLPVVQRVVSGPGVIQGDRLIAVGAGNILIQTLAPGNEDFLPIDFNQTIAVHELFLRSTKSEDGKHLILIWSDTSSILETSLTGQDGWTRVEGAQSPHPVDLQNQTRFFRLLRL